jgi:hypothetical protein
MFTGIRISAARVFSCGGLMALLAACSTGPKTPPPSTDIDETGFRKRSGCCPAMISRAVSRVRRARTRRVAYLVDRFRKLGLKPGNGDSYLQQVPLVEISADNDASLVVSGGGSPKPLEYGKDMVIWTKRECPEAALQHSELVFVGYGIVAPEYQWNDYAGSMCTARPWWSLVNDPGYGTQGPEGVPGRRHDLLRPLDLQARGGRAPRRRRRAADS